MLKQRGWLWPLGRRADYTHAVGIPVPIPTHGYSRIRDGHGGMWDIPSQGSNLPTSDPYPYRTRENDGQNAQ